MTERDPGKPARSVHDIFRDPGSGSRKRPFSSRDTATVFRLSIQDAASIAGFIDSTKRADGRMLSLDEFRRGRIGSERFLRKRGRRGRRRDRSYNRCRCLAREKREHRCPEIPNVPAHQRKKVILAPDV